MRLLIVKIGAVGDVVMALSMVEAARAKDPQAHITWLCGRTVEPLLRAYGKIDEIIVLDDAKLLRGNPWEKARTLMGAWVGLFFRSFDLIVTGHSDPRYGWLSLTARAGERRGFGDRRGLIPGRYHGDEYARLVTGQDGPDAPVSRPILLRPPLSPELERSLSGGGPWVALAPGGAKNLLRDDALRRWPIGHYVRLAGKFVSQGWRVVLTGTDGDRWVLEHFKGLDVIDLVGKTSVTDLVALYGKCRLVVTHDSGPMHLAALSGTPVLALFGPTTPSEKVLVGGPIHPLWGGEDLPCRPCYDGRNYADCSRNLCLESLEVERVWRESERLIISKK
jgi:heptosyltransferase-2